jgi:ferritin-like metal-binding protein YciE
MKNLTELFLEELSDIYSAEQQLVKALPKMVEAAHSDDLKGAIEEHLQETKGHVQRVEEVFEAFDEKPRAKKCKAMAGIIAEGEEMAETEAEPSLKDAGLIAAAQRVEHYEIAVYGTLHTWAGLLEKEEAASLLEQTLEEEKSADERLTGISESINVEAAGGDVAEEEEGDEEGAAARGSLGTRPKAKR